MPAKHTHTVTFTTNDGVNLPVSFVIYNGKDAFEVWKSLPGNTDKTNEEYKKFIRGAPGDFIAKATVTTKSENV